MSSCIATSSFAVMVNGGSSFFKASGGLKLVYHCYGSAKQVVGENNRVKAIKRSAGG